MLWILSRLFLILDKKSNISLSRPSTENPKSLLNLAKLLSSHLVSFSLFWAWDSTKSCYIAIDLLMIFTYGGLINTWSSVFIQNHALLILVSNLEFLTNFPKYINGLHLNCGCPWFTTFVLPEFMLKIIHSNFTGLLYNSYIVLAAYHVFYQVWLPPRYRVSYVNLRGGGFSNQSKLPISHLVSSICTWLLECQVHNLVIRHVKFLCQVKVWEIIN